MSLPGSTPQSTSDKPINSLTAKSNPFGKLTPEDMVVTQDDWNALAATIHNIRSSILEMSFFGSMLQMIDIDFSFRVPTAMISFIPTKKQFLIEINPHFFRHLTLEERMGLLLHEVYHMTHGHLTRVPSLPHRQKAFYAADAAINQFIPGIPTRHPVRGIFVEDFGLPRDKPLEYYYEHWPENEDDEDGEDEEEGEGDGEGEGDSDGQSEGQGKGGKPKGGGSGKGKPIDCHDWDPNVDEGDVLDGMEDVIKRTMIKTSTSHSSLPGSIKDILEHIEKRRSVINWKQQLKRFVKRTTSGVDKEYTRARPSKRYDYASPGLKLGELPKLLILIDSSGSISTTELNCGLDEVDAILKVGSRKVSLGMWHTSLYKVMKYKRNDRTMLAKSVQSGGTCFEACARYIEKIKPDAVIVFTDGYFNDTRTKVTCPVMFVISNGGAKDLPTTYPRQSKIQLPPMERK